MWRLLQRLLQDSLGGNTLTTVMATVSPVAVACEETASTLQFADRAKQVRCLCLPIAAAWNPQWFPSPVAVGFAQVMVRVRVNEVVDDAILLARARVRLQSLLGSPSGCFAHQAVGACGNAPHAASCLPCPSFPPSPFPLPPSPFPLPPSPFPLPPSPFPFPLPPSLSSARVND